MDVVVTVLDPHRAGMALVERHRPDETDEIGLLPHAGLVARDDRRQPAGRPASDGDGNGERTGDGGIERQRIAEPRGDRLQGTKESISTHRA
jgi:hypothetical protein